MDIKAASSVRPSTSDLWFLAYLPLSISDGIATPLVPLLAIQHFGASALVVTIIIAASAMSQVPFTILWGNLSDRVAHRKFFLVGSFLATGVSLVLMALAADILTFFWLNVAEGLASAASAPIGTMLLLETRQKRWWPQDIGLFGLITGVGTTVGLAAGFLWLFVLGFHQSVIAVMTGLLVLSGVLALLSAAIAWAWIEEPTVRIDRRNLPDLAMLGRGALERVRHIRGRILDFLDFTASRADPLPGRERLFLVALGIMSIGFAVFYGPFPVFLLRGTHFLPSSVFIVYLGSSAASTALFLSAGKVVEWHSPKYVFLETLGARFLLILLFLPGPLFFLFAAGSGALVGWMTLLNALMGVTWAFISTASTLFLVRLVGRSSRGRALGLYNAVAGAGGLFGTLLGGYAYVTAGVSSTFLLASGTVLAGAVLLLPIPFHVFTLGRAYPHRRIFRSSRATTAPRLRRR